MAGLALLALLIGGTAGTAWGGEKVPICHPQPDKEPKTYKTKMVDPRKLSNLKHGDVAGTCEDACASGLLCDDGNLCTTDTGAWSVVKGNKGECACTHQCDKEDSCTGEACVPPAPPGAKVPICRPRPDKDPQTYETKLEDPRKLSDLKHGEIPGTCEDNCVNGAFCDDDNLCTSDAGTWTLLKNTTGECGCPHPPVVCNDGNPCTEDSCNPASGCIFTSSLLNTPCGGPPQGGDCDAQDTCDDKGNCIDRVKTSAAACTGGSQAGACDDDANDRCSGSDKTCIDAFLASTEVCRPAAAPCDSAEMCSGSAGACGADLFLPSTTECRPAAGPCDAAENCSGTGAACGADLFLPSTTECRPVAGPCDVAENCSGAGAACGADVVLAAGTDCTGGVCDGMAANCCVPGDCDPGACGMQSDGCGGMIDCGVCMGEACGTGKLCAWGLCGCGEPADRPECMANTTCLSQTGWNCTLHSECATGFCECLGAVGTGEPGSPCDSAGGACRVPLGGDCTQDSDCFTTGAAGSCSPTEKKCVEKRLPLGDPCTPVCKTDPSVPYFQWQDCPGGVWVDEKCKSFDASTRTGLLGLPVEETYCFKNSLTPGNCSNSLHTLCESDADCADLASGTCNFGGPIPGTRCDNNAPPVACVQDSDCPQRGSAVSNYCINLKCGCPDRNCDPDFPCNPRCADANGLPVDCRCMDPDNPFITVPCVCQSQCMKGPMAPGQPTCCLELGQQCQDDADCCQGNHLEPNLATLCPELADGAPCAPRNGEFLGVCRVNQTTGVHTCVPKAELRTRHCIDDDTGFGKICKKWALPGEPCEADADCLDPTGTGITCKNTCANTVFSPCDFDAECPQGESCRNGLCSGPLNNVCDTDTSCPGTETCTGPKLCSPPIQPVKVGKGGVCRPNDDNFVCDDGLNCTDCNYARKGWRCLDPANGCCDNGGLDFELCGDFASGKQCCGWECTTITDPKNCGFCGNDCTTVPPDQVGCWDTSDTCQLVGDPFVSFHFDCNYESQCDAGEQCIGQGVVADCGTGILSPNGLANICCYTPVSPTVNCAGDGCIFDTQPEGMWQDIPLNGRNVCYDSGGCPAGQTCKRSSSKSLYIFQAGTGEDNPGVCVTE